MLFNTAAAQAKINFQNKFNALFPEIHSEITSENLSVCRTHDGIEIFNKVHHIIGSINLQWAAMGKLRIDAPNMTDSQSNELFRLLTAHGLAH